MEKISNRIYSVGVNDQDKVLFEGLWPIPYGVSYNSYLVVDEKVALIDTVECGFEEKYLANIDEVIAIIKRSKDREDATNQLCASFLLDEKQSHAILEMRLQRLTSMEVDKLNEELRVLEATIADLTDILEKPERVKAIVNGSPKRVYACTRCLRSGKVTRAI